MGIIVKGWQWDRYYYVVYLMVNFLVYGMAYSVFPNILVDMKYILNTSMTLISIHPTIETVGYCLGSLVPLLYKQFPNHTNRQFVMTVFMFILAVVTAATPLVPNLWLLYVCAFMFGFGGSINTCGNTPWTIEIFKEKSAPFLQLNNFLFGAGISLTSIILSGYVVGEVEDDEGIDRRAKITAPIVLIAVLVVVVALSSLVMYFVKPYKTPELETQKPEEVIEAEVIEPKLFDCRQTPRKAIRLLFALWFTFYVVFETMFLKFVISYFQHLDHGMDGKEANQLHIISTAVYSVSRLLIVFLSMKFRSKHILIFHYIILIIGAILFIFGQNHITVLWIASPVMFWGFAPMFAGIYSFTAEYLTMSNNMSTLFILSTGLFTLFTPFLIGPFVEEHSYVFLVVTLTYLGASIVLFVVILQLIRRYNSVLIK